MSTDTTEATTETPLEQGVGWIAKHWPRVRLGHEGFMLDKIQRQTRIVEQLAKNTMTNDTTNVDDWPGNDGDDAMGVSIGDHIHNHYHSPAEPPAETPAEPPVEPAPKGMSATAKALTALAAAALLGPGGVGMASLLGAFDKPAASVDTDTDTVPMVIIRPHD